MAAVPVNLLSSQTPPWSPHCRFIMRYNAKKYRQPLYLNSLFETGRKASDSVDEAHSRS